VGVLLPYFNTLKFKEMTNVQLMIILPAIAWVLIGLSKMLSNYTPKGNRFESDFDRKARGVKYGFGKFAVAVVTGIIFIGGFGAVEFGTAILEEFDEKTMEGPPILSVPLLEPEQSMPKAPPPQPAPERETYDERLECLASEVIEYGQDYVYNEEDEYTEYSDESILPVDLENTIAYEDNNDNY